MKKITTLLFTLMALAFNTVSAQTVFGFETAVDDFAGTITETIGDVTMTLTGDPALELINIGNALGTNGQLATTFTGATTSLTFTFDQPVAVNSVIPVDLSGGTLNYTFTPTGGTNEVVVASLTEGTAFGGTVDLNWVGVTSFTVTSSGASMGFDDLSVFSIITPTVFGFETAVDNGPTITETIDGITLTASGFDNSSLGNPVFLSIGNYNETSGNRVAIGATNLVTFTFDQPVGVNSFIAYASSGGSGIDITFTPTGGTNPVVVKTLNASGVAPGAINLNWVDVTSFTVTSTIQANFRFDNLSVYASSGTLSVADDYSSQNQKAKVYPNPVEHTLYIKNISDLESIIVYNSLGQLVLQSKKDSIDVSHLSKGLYFLQIHTSQGSETKRIIKK